MSLISEHRKSRRNHIIVVLHEFRIRYKRKGKTIYGFVEGKEDPSFYRSIIETKLPSDWKLELWSVGGKENVFKIHDKLDWRRFNKEQIIFFVDRDLSDILKEKIKNDKNIYITDGYSIENSIVNKDTCARVLIEVCGLHFLSHDDIDMIVSHFCNQLDRFQKLLIPMMSHIISWRKNGVKANLNAINMKDIFKVCRGILIKKKYPKRTRNYIQYI